MATALRLRCPQGVQVIQSRSFYLSDGLAAFDLPLRVGDARPVELVRLLHSEETGNNL